MVGVRGQFHPRQLHALQVAGQRVAIRSIHFGRVHSRWSIVVRNAKVGSRWNSPCAASIESQHPTLPQKVGNRHRGTGGVLDNVVEQLHVITSCAQVIPVAARLVVPMLERFIATDRGIAKALRSDHLEAGSSGRPSDWPCSGNAISRSAIVGGKRSSPSRAIPDEIVLRAPGTWLVESQTTDVCVPVERRPVTDPYPHRHQTGLVPPASATWLPQSDEVGFVCHA